MTAEKRRKIIIWCNELPSVRALSDALSRNFQLSAGADMESILSLVSGDQPPFAVIIDNSIAQNKAIETLQSVRNTCRDAKRVLLTDYCDLAIIVHGLHTEAVQKIVYKPIHGPELLCALGVAAVAPMMPAASAMRAPAYRAV